MKKFLNRLGMIVLTAAMLTLPITGCGGSSDTGAAGSTSAAGNASSAAAGSETDNDEIVKLRVWGLATRQPLMIVQQWRKQLMRLHGTKSV